MLLKKKKRKKGTVRLCLWCSINVDTKMSGPSLTLHFLSSPPSHLSFLPPPALILSLSHPTLNILPPIYIPSRMMTKRAAERTQKKEDSLFCINAVLWKLMGGVGGGGGGDIWLSHSNLCRVKHCRWAGEGGREKVGSVVITERDHYSVKEAALVLISFKSRFWIRISGGRLRGFEEKSSSQWSCQWWPCLLERWERQNERWGEEKGQRGVIERPLRANSTVDVGVRPVPWRP